MTKNWYFLLSRNSCCWPFNIIIDRPWAFDFKNKRIHNLNGILFCSVELTQQINFLVLVYKSSLKIIESLEFSNKRKMKCDFFSFECTASVWNLNKYGFQTLKIKLGKIVVFVIRFRPNQIYRVCILKWIKITQKEVIGIVKGIKRKQIEINNATWFTLKSWIMLNTDESKWVNCLV